MTTSAPTRLDPAERDRIEAIAVADMVRAAPGPLARALGIAAGERGGVLMLRVDAVHGAREFNRAMGLGPGGGDVRRQLAGLGRFFAGRPHIASLGPGASEDARRAMAEAGYAPGYAWDTFARTGLPAAPVRTGLTVRRACRTDAPAAGEVIRAAFGLPPPVGEWVAAIVGRPRWTFVVAEDRGTIVSAGAVMIDGDAAWLGFGGTLASHRGRGAQSGLFAARIAAATEAGCTLLATETGVPGDAGPGPSYRNILRAGFTPVRRRENWQSAPDHRRT